MQCLYNALIRTHHITSRKKVAKLKQAASLHDVYVLIRYGGAPGVMYVEGKEDGVTQWVNNVQVKFKNWHKIFSVLCVLTNGARIFVTKITSWSPERPPCIARVLQTRST